MYSLMGMPSGAGISEVLKAHHPALLPSKSAEFVAREYCEQFRSHCPAGIQICLEPRRVLTPPGMCELAARADSRHGGKLAAVGLVAEEQTLMNTAHVDVEQRVGRQVRAGQDNLQVIAAERHAITGFRFIERDGGELTADL